MYLVKSISVASSEEIRLENQYLNDSITRASLFPNIKQFVTFDSQLMIIQQCSNANIKAFYLTLLQYIVQGMAHYNPQVRSKSYHVLTQVKKHLYRKNTVLNCIKNIPNLRVQNDPKKNTAFTSLQMKKLLGQFFHLLLEGSDYKTKIERIFEKYSFIPILLNIFFRSLLWLQYDIDNATDYNQYIDDQSVFNCLSGLFGLQDFSYSNGQIHCLGSKIVIENINFLNNSKSKLSILNKRIYFINYKKQIFKDLTFSLERPVRFRAQTQQMNQSNNRFHTSPAETNVQRKQKTSFMSFKNMNLKRYDSYEEQIVFNINQQKDSDLKAKQNNEEKHNLKKNRISIEQTNGSQPIN